MLNTNILENIGDTPLVNLAKIAESIESDIFVKCEYVNPSGSIKDRVALKMITEAEKRGDLQPGGIVTESSTGNTAIALSFVSVARGYKPLIFMPQGWVTEDRLKILEAYGAEIREIDIGEEIEELKGKSVHGGVVEVMPRIKALELEKNNPEVWWAKQALNPDNVNAHKETTAQEIIEQTEGNIDVFVSSIGTGGTLLGVGEALKELNPSIKIYGVEPESASLFNMAPEVEKYMKKYQIPGVEGALIDEIAEKNIVEDVIVVTNDDAVNMAHRLCREEGLFCGMSSGANVYVSLKIAEKIGPDKRIVTILPDSRDRYLINEHFTT